MPTGQAINPAWRTANAAAFGGDANVGPFQVGTAFGGGAYPLPAQNGAGQYQYYLAEDLACDGTGLVFSNAVQLDLNGHTLTFSNATPAAGLNGDFESDTPGSPPAGWDISGCVEAPPAVYAPAAHGLYNMLYGANVLAWTGAGGVPGPRSATASLDGSNNLVFTFSGSAPASGRQVMGSSFAVTNLVSQPASTQYANTVAFYVVSPSGSACKLSQTPGGTPLQAQTVTTAAGHVAAGQTLRTSSTVTIPRANVWYCFKLAMGASAGWANGSGYNVPVLQRVFASDGVTQIGSSLSGGARPSCQPVFWMPTTTSPVYLELTIFSAGPAPPSVIDAWLDAIHLVQAFDFGVVCTNLDSFDIGSAYGATGIRPMLALPAAMQSGYQTAGSSAVIDSAGGGGIVQGRASAANSGSVLNISTNHPLTVQGFSAGSPMVVSLTGANSNFVDLTHTATGADKTVRYVSFSYGGDVDVFNRQHFVPGINFNSHKSNIVIDHVAVTGVPQMFVFAGGSSTGQPAASAGSTCSLTNFAVTGAMQVSNCYLINITYKEQMTIGPGTVGGTGYAIGFYPGSGTPDGTGAINNISVTNVTIDVSAVPEREYGSGQLMRAVKAKTISYPSVAFSNILFQDCSITARCLTGYGTGVCAASIDVHPGGTRRDSGNFRFVNCTLAGVIDNTPGVSGYAVSFDHCDPSAFPVFFNCTLSGTTAAVLLNGPDAYGAQGTTFIGCTFAYLAVAGVANTYQVFFAGKYQWGTRNTFVVDPIWDASVTSGMRGVLFSTSGTGGANFTPYAWATYMVDPGVGYGSNPSVTLPGETSSFDLVRGPDVLTNPTGAVLCCPPGADPIPLHTSWYGTTVTPLTVSGGSPTTPARVNCVLEDTTWPWRSVYAASGLTLTVVDAGTGLPVAGAAVTVVDNLGTQWFPAVPGSCRPDGSPLIPGTTDAGGNVGVATGVPVVILPTLRLCQGDPTGQQSTSPVQGTILLDGTVGAFSQGSGSSAAVASSYTLTITAAGYATFTHALNPGSPITLTANLSAAGPPTQYLLLRPGP